MSKKQLRAAIYARYSTAKQKEASIKDQVRECRRICEREGFTVVDTFSDAAISGGTAKRPGYQALLAAARRKDFDAVVAESTSRLWREVAEQWRALKEWTDAGIIVVGNGIDTRRPEASILLSVTGAANEAFRQEIGRRTREAQLGLTEKGYVAGGRTYGYRHVKRMIEGRDKPITERVIEPSEAKVVNRIFKMRAEGHSALAIARALNKDGIPSPGAAWARTSGVKPAWRASALIGDPRFGTGILSNPLYRGRSIWGRMKWKRSSSDSSVRTPVAMPEREWIVHSVPHLRIVDDKLWDTVQKLQTADTPLRAAIRKGIRMSPNKGKGNYWLSGILVCDLCGSNLQVNSGVTYRCPNYHAGNCKNDRLFKRADIEAAMLEILKVELLAPQRIKVEQKRIEAILKDRERQERQRSGTDELRRVNAQIAGVRKLGISEAATRAALAELEREREDLQAREGKRQSAGLREARRLLAKLPGFAAEFERQLQATLTGRVLTKDEMRTVTEATRQLIEGGTIRMRPCKEGVKGRVPLVGFGSRVLRLGGTARGPRVSGSGGRI